MVREGIRRFFINNFFEGVKMNKLAADIIELLRKTMISAELSPERAAAFIGCSGRQIRRWIEGKANITPIYLSAIEAGIRKIHREFSLKKPEDLPPKRTLTSDDEFFEIRAAEYERGLKDARKKPKITPNFITKYAKIFATLHETNAPRSIYKDFVRQLIKEIEDKYEERK
jgi:hypothetical protein